MNIATILIALSCLYLLIGMYEMTRRHTSTLADAAVVSIAGLPVFVVASLGAESSVAALIVLGLSFVMHALVRGHKNMIDIDPNDSILAVLLGK